jgi:hypothetical protein
MPKRIRVFFYDSNARQDSQLPKLEGMTMSLTVLSAPALANRLPVGLKARAVIAKEWA